MVVINLGTNDASYTRGIADREQRFADNYESLIKKTADRFSEANIVVIYGMIERSLCDVISRMVEKLKESGLSISYIDVDYTDRSAIDGHPCEMAHKKISEIIYEKIKEI